MNATDDRNGAAQTTSRPAPVPASGDMAQSQADLREINQDSERLDAVIGDAREAVRKAHDADSMGETTTPSREDDRQQTDSGEGSDEDSNEGGARPSPEPEK